MWLSYPPRYLNAQLSVPQDKYRLADLHSDCLLRSIVETVPRRRLRSGLQGTIADELLWESHDGNIANPN